MAKAAQPAGIEEILDRNRDHLMQQGGVNGVAIGVYNDRPTIVVLVEHLTPDVESHLPHELGGHPVRIEEIGALSAL